MYIKNKKKQTIIINVIILLFLVQLQEQQDQEKQCNLDLQQPQHCSEKPPLIRISSEQFAMKTLDRNYTFKEFRTLRSVSVDPNERNVFVEVGWLKLDGLKIHDMILMGKVSGQYDTLVR